MPTAPSFDALREWHHLSDGELRERFSEEVKVTLVEAAALLMDRPLPGADVSAASFPGHVRRLNDLYAAGSRELGKAILQAGDHKDGGRIADAAAVLRRFVEACPSPFYRGIAQHQLQELGGHDG